MQKGEMTIAGFSGASAKPLLDEGRRFCSRKRMPVRRMEVAAGHDTPAQQSALPNYKPQSSQGLSPAHLSADGSIPPPPRLAFVYGTLKRGFGNHWLMEELMAAEHAHFLGLACTKRRFPLVCGPFQVPFLLPSPSAGHQVRGELYQVDSLAISRLDDLEGVSKGHYERRPIDVFILPHDADELTQDKVMETDTHMHQSDGDTHSNGDMDPSYLDLDASSWCNLAGPLTSCRLYLDPPYLDDMDTSSEAMLASQSSGPSEVSPSEVLRAEAYFASPSYGLQMADRAPHIPCYTEKEASTYVRRKDRPHGRTFLEHIHAWIEENGLIFT